MGEQSAEDEVRLLSASQKADIRQGLREALQAPHWSLATACGGYMAKYGVSYAALRSLMNSQLPDYLAGVPAPRRPFKGVPAQSQSSRLRTKTRATAEPKQTKPKQTEKRPPPSRRLTTNESVMFLAAYREAYALRGKALERCLTEFEARYHVPRKTLNDLVTVDKKRAAACYRALDYLYDTEKRQRADEQQRRALLRSKPTSMSVADYFGRATYCPVCRRDFETTFVPPHGPRPHGCRGSGKFGVSLYAVQHNTGSEEPPNRWSGSGSGPTVSGGLPGLGRRR
jgi:hypothetical protein